MTLQETLDFTEIKENINKIWNQIEQNLNAENRKISSERTLVFQFAWSLNSCKGLKIQNIDFERTLFDDNFNDGMFLDLYFEVLIEGSIYRIGIEFKFPNKKKNNSGQTQIRQKIINDVKRLNYLVNENKIDLGIFLCASNENYYPSNNKRKVEPNFKVHHGIQYFEGNNYPTNGKYYENVIISNDIKFEWRNIENINDNFFTFLEPLFLKKRLNNL